MKNCQHKKPQAKPLFWSQKIDSREAKCRQFCHFCHFRSTNNAESNEIRNRILNGNQQLEQNQIIIIIIAIIIIKEQ